MTARAMTITEALAELKTLDKRIDKKRETIKSYLVRQDALKDPLANQGGSAAFVANERRAVTDLENNIIKIRTEVQRVNGTTVVAIDGESRTITEWLVWRRDVAPKRQADLAAVRHAIDGFRRQGMQKGLKVVAASANAQDLQPTDIIVNLDEKALSEEAEKLEMTLGTLDGLLSLKNATVTITV